MFEWVLCVSFCDYKLKDWDKLVAMKTKDQRLQLRRKIIIADEELQNGN